MDVVNKPISKTRKEHRCWGCAQIIPIGSECQRSATFDGGSVSSAYWCEWCQEVSAKTDYWVFEDGCDIGEVAEYYDEHTSEYTPIKAERLTKKGN